MVEEVEKPQKEIGVRKRKKQPKRVRDSTYERFENSPFYSDELEQEQDQDLAPRPSRQRKDKGMNSNHAS